MALTKKRNLNADLAECIVSNWPCLLPTTAGEKFLQGGKLLWTEPIKDPTAQLVYCQQNCSGSGINKANRYILRMGTIDTIERIEILRDPGPMKDAPRETGVREEIAFVADPDGYKIELIGRH